MSLASVSKPTLGNNKRLFPRLLHNLLLFAYRVVISRRNAHTRFIYEYICYVFIMLCFDILKLKK